MQVSASSKIAWDAIVLGYAENTNPPPPRRLRSANAQTTELDVSLSNICADIRLLPDGQLLGYALHHSEIDAYTTLAKVFGKRELAHVHVMDQSGLVPSDTAIPQIGDKQPEATYPGWRHDKVSRRKPDRRGIITTFTANDYHHLGARAIAGDVATEPLACLAVNAIK